MINCAKPAAMPSFDYRSMGIETHSKTQPFSLLTMPLTRSHDNPLEIKFQNHLYQLAVTIM